MRSDWQRTKIGGKIVVSPKGGDRRKREPVLWGTGMKNLSSCQSLPYYKNRANVFLARMIRCVSPVHHYFFLLPTTECEYTTSGPLDTNKN